MNKALLIGINKYLKVTGLAGCVADVEDMRLLLTTTHSVDPAHIKTLVDDKAVKSAIVDELKSLVAGAKPNDHLYVHFSGHGAQLPSSDRNEPDGADEVLCPHDFDWEATTAVVDDELRSLLSALPSGALLTFTVDACHSGDFSRALAQRTTAGVARTPIPPPAIAARLKNATTLTRMRSLEAGGNSAVISACRPWETAKDTSFDGKPAGAFTHFFCAAVRDAEALSVEATLATIAPSLAPYDMHSVAEGGATITAAPFAARPGHRSPMDRRLVQLPRRRDTMWETSWSVNLFGQRGDVAIALVVSGSDITAQIRVNAFGGGEWHLLLNGNTTFSLDLAFAVQLRIYVRNWSLVQGMLRLDLSTELFSPFFGSIPVGAVPVSITLLSNRDLDIYAPQSAADFMALLSLRSNQALGSLSPRSIPSPIMPRAPGEIVYMAGDNEGWGPNWREDRAVRITQRARATKRHSVVLDPVKGGGHAEFVRWLTDDERDPSFVLHIGCGFFEGWGSVQYTVQGIYERDDPFQPK